MGDNKTAEDLSRDAVVNDCKRMIPLCSDFAQQRVKELFNGWEYYKPPELNSFHALLARSIKVEA